MYSTVRIDRKKGNATSCNTNSLIVSDEALAVSFKLGRPLAFRRRCVSLRCRGRGGASSLETPEWRGESSDYHSAIEHGCKKDQLETVICDRVAHMQDNKCNRTCETRFGMGKFLLTRQDYGTL